jgi:putative oxidoreductase
MPKPRHSGAPVPQRGLAMGTQTTRTTAINDTGILLGRFGLALIFILSGWSKIAGYEGTEAYMAAAGVPGALLPLVIALELAGGLAVLAGFKTRWAALALALFSLASAMLFHADFADQNQFIGFMKNVAIAGGFLVLAAQGAGRFSIDALLGRDTRGAAVATTA